MVVPAELDNYHLCRFFLSGYLSKRDDPINFPPDEIPVLFSRYEAIFESALIALDLPKEGLKKREEFNFDSGDPANLESAIGVLRTVETLRQLKFHGIALIKPPGADVLCEKDGQRVCCEVKTIIKQSKGRSGLYLANQLYEKILETIPRARMQLQQSAAKLQCSVTIFSCVFNWLGHSVLLDKDEYQYIVNRLEKDKLHGEDNFLESLKGIDGVLFVSKLGNRYLFLNERGKSIDR
jgi:hypothetical protein